MAVAVLTSVADPTLSVEVPYRYAKPIRVRDVAERRWDDRPLPEVHRGSTDYIRWEWTPRWPAGVRADAEAFLTFVDALHQMADARVDMVMPTPVGSGQAEVSMRVEFTNPEVVDDIASVPTATEVPLTLVQVD